MLSRKVSSEKYKIFADYGCTGLWVLDNKGIWLSCDPTKDMSLTFRQTLHDWMMYFQADLIRNDLGIVQGCISLRMFNAIGENLATQLHRETSTPVHYQTIKDTELFCHIIKDVNHTDNPHKI